MHEQHSDHVSRPKSRSTPSYDILVGFILVLDNQLLREFGMTPPDALLNLLQHPSHIHLLSTYAHFRGSIVS